jgi:hypothetical protein
MYEKNNYGHIMPIYEIKPLEHWMDQLMAQQHSNLFQQSTKILVEQLLSSKADCLASPTCSKLAGRAPKKHKPTPTHPTNTELHYHAQYTPKQNRCIMPTRIRCMPRQWAIIHKGCPQICCGGCAMQQHTG